MKTILSRRAFIKAVGAAGFGSALGPLGSVPAADSAQVQEQTVVPKRPFGKTGVDVSILSLGGVLKSTDQLVFRQAFKSGVTYWDTADSYGWGGNEKAIGSYFAKYPDDRREVFLVTKTASSDPKELSEKLNTSLQRMNTSYIDMYCLHYVSDVGKELTAEVKAWAENAKSKGTIRLFGFSAHKNMEESLPAAAKLGWVDGIMMTYNYRLMVKERMKRAVDACAKAGIGLTAMKTQAAFSANFWASIGSETDDALKLTENFLKKGYTAEQARLKAVWENPQIASICSAMPNMTILQANIDAALSKQSLSEGDRRRLDQYALATAPGYCCGCAHICESAVELDVPISDILRCAMYDHGYGRRDMALGLFNTLPAGGRENVFKADFAKAESSCPQNIRIGSILKRTCEELG